MVDRRASASIVRCTGTATVSAGRARRFGWLGGSASRVERGFFSIIIIAFRLTMNE